MAITSLISQLEPKKILVLGDLMLDQYIIGNVDKVSPEAPVPVVHVQREEYKAGGAGNVALNLSALGAFVTVLGRVGADQAGQKLIEEMQKQGIDASTILEQKGYMTPLKKRVIAQNQQLVRIDREVVEDIPKDFEQKLVVALSQKIDTIDVIAVSDYGKGVCTESFLQKVFQLANKKGIPVIVDPKKKPFVKYRGCTVIKPNFKESVEATNLSDDTPIDTIAKSLLEITEAKYLMITRSQEGISIFQKEKKAMHFPVKIKQVKDVTGAGDTVLAMLSYAMANRLSLADCALLCNIAAGIAIEKVGCAKVTLSQVAHRMLTWDAENKVFDEAHLKVLKQALKGKPFTLLHLNREKMLDHQVFEKILSHSKDAKGDLVINICDDNPSQPFLDLLSSIQGVDFILLSNKGIDEINRVLSPEKFSVC